MASVHPHRANLLAQYAASWAIGTRPPRLDTLTTHPASARQPVGEQRQRHAHRRVEVDVHHVRDVGRR